LFSVVALYSVFICSENTSFHVNACNNLLDVTLSKDATRTYLAQFQLSGVSFLPITFQGLQATSDHSLHLRLGLKEVVREDFSEKFASADDCVASIEAMQSAPFYYRCRRCGCVVLDQHL